MTRVLIRPAGAEMAAVLSQLHMTCFAPLPETPWSETAMRTILRMPGTRGYVIGDAQEVPRGLLIGRETAGDAEILTVCVAPDSRRRGMARDLFAAFLADIAPDSRLVLEVAVDNAGAIRLYESLGFKPIGRRPAYYGGGETRVDAVVLARAPESSNA